jgi:hypothetical protein
MFDIQLWLATAGKRVMLVYGQNDPWSAGAFALGLAQDSYRYDVPGGNHGSFITQLPEPAQSEALATLARWANSPIVPFLAPAAANENARSSGTTEWQEDRARRVPL